MNPSLEKKRPLSPHLQIYKVQITSFLSILHRATGFVLYLGSLLWSIWFLALSEGEESYIALQQMFFHPIGLLILFGWSFSFYYHLSNGLRHLMWDLGKGYDMFTVRFTGWAVVITSIILTAFTWVTGILLWEIWR